MLLRIPLWMLLINSLLSNFHFSGINFFFTTQWLALRTGRQVWLHKVNNWHLHSGLPFTKRALFTTIVPLPVLRVTVKGFHLTNKETAILRVLWRGCIDNVYDSVHFCFMIRFFAAKAVCVLYFLCSGQLLV